MSLSIELGQYLSRHLYHPLCVRSSAFRESCFDHLRIQRLHSQWHSFLSFDQDLILNRLSAALPSSNLTLSSTACPFASLCLILHSQFCSLPQVYLFTRKFESTASFSFPALEIPMAYQRFYLFPFLCRIVLLSEKQCISDLCPKYLVRSPCSY